MEGDHSNEYPSLSMSCFNSVCVFHLSPVETQGLSSGLEKSYDGVVRSWEKPSVENVSRIDETFVFGQERGMYAESGCVHTAREERQLFPSSEDTA